MLKERCIKLFLPARKDIEVFKKFIKFCADFGINTVILEVGGAMQYFRHSEINTGWEEYCSNFAMRSGLSEAMQYHYNFPKNSIHWENGGGSFLTQIEVRSLVEYINGLSLAVIPEVPSLTHSDYLLVNHLELSERKDDKFPDHYCPMNSGSYDLLFDVIDEIIEVFKPKIINIGHDELYSVGLCEKCKARSATSLYYEDIMRIYNYIKSRDISVMMWGDKLLKSVDKQGHNYGGNQLTMVYEAEKGGGTVNIPAVYSVIDMLPRDIIICHWHYLFGDNDSEFIRRGYKTLYGNFNPFEIPGLYERINRGIDGYVISNWAKVSEDVLQRNGIYFFVAYIDYLMKDESRFIGEFRQNALAVSTRLFSYRNSETLQKSHIEITHNSSCAINHHVFFDGYFPDYEADKLGEYEIVFANGGLQNIPIYYGLNIGRKGVTFELKMNDNFDIYETCPHLIEPIGTCDFVVCGDDIAYKIVVPCDEQAEIVSYKFVSCNAKNVVNTYKLCYNRVS